MALQWNKTQNVRIDGTPTLHSSQVINALHSHAKIRSQADYPCTLASFAHWVGIFIALIYGQFFSDRLPLFLCRRFGHGIWKPEFRLHALWIPSLIFNPIGLALFGAGLQYHLSWAVLALGQVFVTFGSLAITPITVNYINECFINTPAEASIAVNLYRVGFGLSVAF